jgi:uncharacterized membrane protein YidH (DUF202 family)
VTRNAGGAGSCGGAAGLQVERTVLAWDRTALAVLVNAALLLVRNVHGTDAAALVPAVVALVVAIAVAVLGRRRARQLGGGHAQNRAADRPAFRSWGDRLVRGLCC